MPDAAPSTRLRLTGPSIDVSNRHPIALSDAEIAHVVAAGELVVFAVERNNGEAGARRFLLSAGPGEVVIGVPPTAGFEVMGSGNTGTQVHPVPLTHIHRSDEAAALVEAWASKVSAGVERYQRTERALATEVAEPLVPPSSIAAASSHGDSSAFGRHALIRLASAVQANKVADEARLDLILQQEAEIESQAVADLSGVLGARDEKVIVPSGNPLMEACRTAGAHSDILIAEPEHPLPQNLRSALREIAKVSQIRTRRVTLEGDWWRGESEPMVATLRDGQDPVALVPSGSRGYELIDHARGERHTLDTLQAARLSGEAYVLYRTWPAVPLSGRHVLSMGLRGTRGDLLRIAGFGVATALLALVTPIATAALFNQVIPTAARERLLVLVGALVLGAIGSAAFQMAQGVALVRLQTRLNASLGAALWDRILRLPVPFFRQYSVGDLATRTLAIDAIRQILAQTGFSIVLSALFSLSSLVLLFVFDASLAFIAVVLLVVSIAVTFILTLRQVGRQRELVELRGQVSGLVIQQVVGVSKLRVTASERRAFRQWTTLYARQQHLAYAAGKLRNIQAAFDAAWVPFTTLVVFWWLSRRSLASIDPGTFLAFFAAFGQILIASRAITGALGGMLQAVPLYERAKPILEAVPEVGGGAQDPGPLAGRVEVNHVAFRYEPDGPIVLQDVSIAVEPGQFVALVGPSGAGKSSLIRLLLGFDKPEAGSILFDGKDLDTLDIELVRRQIGVVLQTAQLIPGSIFTNIVGETDLTRDDAWLAATQAGLDGDLRDMPMGMDTLITEGSATLSGGQKQRLLIARALAAKPRFLLFDEATSALDNVTQRIVTKSLEQLAVTRIVIAHRLSTIAGADKIVVMERGRVVESGAYDELMAAGGPFAELASRQIV